MDVPSVSIARPPGGRSMGVVNARERGNVALKTHFLDLLRVSLGKHPHAFDNNFRTIRSPLGYVSVKGRKLDASERIR